MTTTSFDLTQTYTPLQCDRPPALEVIKQFSMGKRYAPDSKTRELIIGNCYSGYHFCTCCTSYRLGQARCGGNW